MHLLVYENVCSAFISDEKPFGDSPGFLEERKVP